VTLQLSYTISFQGNEIVSVDAPSFTAPLAMPTSFPGLLQSIVDAIGGAVESLAEALLNNPGQTATFLAAVVAPSVLSQLANVLICNGYLVNPGAGGTNPPAVAAA
jgi:hypothetical protein